ncbi:hypothetical protein [Actinomadura sp. RB99]|nr:hypothetical protein [Actinomadura sp. RB99]
MLRALWAGRSTVPVSAIAIGMSHSGTRSQFVSVTVQPRPSSR